MATCFLYIDDENPKTSEGLVKNLRNEDLEIKIEQPKSWNEQKHHLIGNKEIEKYDGLLLDLKLEFSDGDTNQIKYSGADLAQTIRSDVKAGKIKDLPIFLCSTDNNFMAFFDRTSIDLFDKKYYKNIDLDKDFTRLEFIFFSKAYKAISKNQSIESLMNKKIEDNDELFSLQLIIKDFKTAHEFVYFINNYVIQSNGMLIDEEVLAIKLGIDYRNSPDWLAFKKHLPQHVIYKGILSECYERWWQLDLIKWWKSVFGISLKIMSSNDRVNAIVEKYGLKALCPITTPKHHRFDTPWYKCRLSNVPLDPSDALKTIEMPRFVWQEPSYISFSYIKSEDRDLELILSLLGINETRMIDHI